MGSVGLTRFSSSASSACLADGGRSSVREVDPAPGEAVLGGANCRRVWGGGAETLELEVWQNRKKHQMALEHLEHTHTFTNTHTTHTRAQGPEILARLWRKITEQLCEEGGNGKQKLNLIKNRTARESNNPPLQSHPPKKTDFGNRQRRSQPVASAETPKRSCVWSSVLLWNTKTQKQTQIVNFFLKIILQRCKNAPEGRVLFWKFSMML